MPTNRRLASYKSEDFYPTPAWATHALMETEKFYRGDTTWEPACGDGSMVKVLQGYFEKDLIISDINPRGCYDSEKYKNDFLYGYNPLEVDNIITNPPFNLAEEFIERGLSVARNKLALLLRLSFLESRSRYYNIFHHAQKPPSVVWVFSERVTFWENGIKTGSSGTTAYAWFVWNIADRMTIGGTSLKWIPPIFKEFHKERIEKQ